MKLTINYPNYYILNGNIITRSFSNKGIASQQLVINLRLGTVSVAALVPLVSPSFICLILALPVIANLYNKNDADQPRGRFYQFDFSNFQKNKRLFIQIQGDKDLCGAQDKDWSIISMGLDIFRQ